MNAMTALAQRVRCERLSCGARVYLIENHTNLTVSLVGYVDGGLFLEDPADAGVANLCISMLDRGTPTRDQAAIADALESNGARLAYGLTREVVTVRAHCLSEDLPLVLDIFGDTLTQPSFPDAELAIVREDAKAGLREAAYDTYTQAGRRSAEMLLGSDHPYARESLGRGENLDRLGCVDLERYHAAAIAGGRLHLAVIGDIRPDETLAMLERELGDLPRGESLPEGTFTDGHNDTPAGEDPARHARREHVEICDKEQVDIVFLSHGVPRTAEGFESYGLANFIFGGSFVSRLNQRLRDTDGLTYGAQSAIISGSHPGVWLAHVGVHPDHRERAIEGVLAEMRQMAADGITKAELKLAQQHLSGSFPIRLETNRAIAAALLEGLRAGRGLDFIDRYRERLMALTREQVNAATKTLLGGDEVVVVSSGTESQGRVT
jgi:zinc protease